MSGSRAYRLLQLELAADAGVPVEIRWDSSVLSARRPGRWAWHVFWSDGPTVAAMRARAAPDLSGVDVDDLVYDRALSPRSYALAMIRHLRQGRPPLGGHQDLDAMTQWMHDESHPERGSVEDVELASRLARLANGQQPAMVAILDRLGLAAITGAISSGNVTPLQGRDE